nr:NLR_family_CARD_domain-containing_3-like protein isoform_X5 [Sebastes schlegelii]
MSQCVDKEEGVPPSKTTLCGDHDSQTRAQRIHQEPDSPEPEPSCVSMKSDWSMDRPPAFKDGRHSDEQRVDQESSEVPSFQSAQQHQTHLDSIFMLLEENIVTFVKNELKKIQKVINSDYPECLESEREDEEVLDGEDEEKRRSREEFLKITVHFLRRMKQEELTDCLQSRTVAAVCQRELKSNLKKKFQCVFEGIAKAGNPTLLNQVYTELYITEGGTAEVNDEHEVRQIETAFRKPDRPETTIRQEDIFKASPGRNEPIRTVMTKGVAGIGKTVLTQKFTLDCAEDKANRDLQFTFPFTFRELNVLREKKYSLVELVHDFFTETKEAGICRFEEFQVVFIFDGLDECRLPLDFHNNEILTDVTESTSVDVLLTNLIRGNLLPSAHIWITTRPAAANQVPPECVDMVTETSRSLHIMCHIPVFCWITSTVLEEVLKTREGGELPKTLTEIYIYFLVVQSKMKNIKYDGGAETDSHWSPESRKIIQSLGKLAFDQLQKGNLIFYESDLTDVQEFLAALHVHLTFINSGVNLMAEEETTSLKSETHFYQSAVDKALQSPNGHLDLFLRFLLGLSLQTNQTFLRGLLTQTGSSSQTNQETVQYIRKKLDEDVSAEKSINLFHCLNELNNHSLVEEIQQYLSSGLLFQYKLSPAQWSAVVFILLSREDLDVFDLKKYSASEEALLRLLPVVKASNKVLLSGCNLSERSCKALSSVLSSQSSSLRELNLSNNNLQDSEVKLFSAGLESPHCTLETLRLSGCLITEEGCSSLASALSSSPSHLRELDLSYNHPGDSGGKLLSSGLEDPHWKLDTLRYKEACCSIVVQYTVYLLFRHTIHHLFRYTVHYLFRYIVHYLLRYTVHYLFRYTVHHLLRYTIHHLLRYNLHHQFRYTIHYVFRYTVHHLLRYTVHYLFRYTVHHLFMHTVCHLFRYTVHHLLRYTIHHLLRYTLHHQFRYTIHYVFRYTVHHLLRYTVHHMLRYTVHDLFRYTVHYLFRYTIHHLFRYTVHHLLRYTVHYLLFTVHYQFRYTVHYQFRYTVHYLLRYTVHYLFRYSVHYLIRYTVRYLFRVEPAGVRWLTPGLRKYSCELTLDTNTVNRKLKLSDNNRKVTYVEEVQSYPDHPDRFDPWPQLLCRTGLTGRCYWEVECRGRVSISVSYRGISRRGDGKDCVFGRNNQSWCLCCYGGRHYFVCHNDSKTPITITTTYFSSSDRVAVYVDCPAGTLSFYRVSFGTLIHLHTFNTTFTEPLYPGFGFGFGSGFGSSSDSSVSLCSPH